MYYRITKNLVIALLCTQFSMALADYTKEGGQPEWMKYTQPGEGHQIFKALEGKWKHTVKWWMNPTAKPEEHKGTNTNKLIMGGRFLQQDTKGKAMGQAFTGMGITGYNTMKQEYQSVWVS